MAFTREQIQRLISEQNRVKSAISAHKRESRSPMDVFEQFVVEMLDRRAEALKKDVIEALKQSTPIKGVHYFDGEKGDMGESGKDSVIPGPKGEKGDRGIDGIDGRDGKDGKNISPKEARMILVELLNDMKAEDFGALTKKEAEAMLKQYDGKSGKSLEKRLTALQDAVFRNYGGHGGKSGGGTGGSTLLQEVPSGTVDSVNTIFTVANLPIYMEVSGQIMVSKTENPANYGYTVSGGGPYTITFVNAPTQSPNSFYNTGTSTGTTYVYNEIVSGSGTNFVLAHTPVSGPTIYALGQRLYPTTDYTIAGATITCVNSWLSGQILADYQY